MRNLAPRKLLSLTSIFLLIFATLPWGVASAQANQLGQAPTTGWQKSRLSQAVIDDADRAAEIVVMHSKTGQLSSDDLENAAMALKILFDHYQEIGLNAAFQKELLANQDGFLNLQLSDPQLSAFQAKLAANGIDVDSAKLNSTLNLTFGQKQQFLAMVKAIGLYGTEMDAVAELEVRAQNLATSPTYNPAQFSRLSPRMKGHLVFVMSAPCKACFILAGIGGITGCTLTEPACAAAIAVCLTCSLGG